MRSVPSSAATVPPEQLAPSPPPVAKRTSWRKLWFFTAVSALAAIGGASLLRSPTSVSADVRSGSPGFKLTTSGDKLHWAKKGTTVYLDSSLSRLSPAANEAVMQAFGQWLASDPELPAISFDTGATSTQPKRDGKSTVSYGFITEPGHLHDVAITISYSNDRTGEIVEADIILNALYPIGVLTAKPLDTSPRSADPAHVKGGKDKSTHGDESLDCRNRYDAQNVLTHEPDISSAW